MSYWVAGATVVGGIASAVSSSNSAKKAAGAVSKGSDQAIAEAQRQFDLVRGDTAGQRFIGNGATNTLARLYGYGTPPAMGAGGGGYGAATYQPAPIKDGGFFNSGTGSLLNPATVSSKLGSAGKILDPAYGLFGNLFGNKHGDEKRNLDAFLKDNQVYDLGNGMLQLADGTQFKQDQLKDIAGTYYGAKYAPDGNQGEWQQRYSTLLGGLPKAQGAQGNAGGGLTSDGVPNSAPMQVGAGQPGKPDMSAFFESPDYQFNLGEGQKAIDRSLAARGGALSGGGVREGVRYASGMASREFGGFVDRLMQQAGLGSTGIAASAAAGANASNNIGNAYMNAGNANASAYMQQGQGINNSIQGGISNLILARYLRGG